jgi:hypothetical protein
LMPSAYRCDLSHTAHVSESYHGFAGLMEISHAGVFERMVL